jgi:thioredoxin 1
MAGNDIVTLSEANFDQEVNGSDLPVLIDFWAEWCGPCKMIAPVLEEIAKEQSGVKIGKVNVDENPNLATRFQIRAIPTLLFFKDGQVADQVVGMAGKSDLVSKIEALA